MPEPTLHPAIDPSLRHLLTEDGPTYDELKAQQQPLAQIGARAKEMGNEIAETGIAHYLEHKAFHYAEHAVSHFFHSVSLADKIALVGKAFTIATTAAEGTIQLIKYSVHEPMEEGEKGAEARTRDWQNLGLLMVVQTSDAHALPDGYFQSELSRVLGTGGRNNIFNDRAFNAASQFLAKVDGGDAEAVHSRDVLMTSLREGVALAYQKGLDGKNAVEELGKIDPNFKTRYESDPAFRDGINSVIWQATYHRDEYEQAISVNSFRGVSGRI